MKVTKCLHFGTIWKNCTLDGEHCHLLGVARFVTCYKLEKKPVDPYEDITLYRRGDRPEWIFKYDKSYQGHVHKTNSNVYKLFFEDPKSTCKPFWIGRLTPNKDSWYTAEKAIYAMFIQFVGSTLHFD